MRANRSRPAANGAAIAAVGETSARVTPSTDIRSTRGGGR
jgi:hypothetical protein